MRTAGIHCSNIMTLDEAAGHLDVTKVKVLVLARQGKLRRLWPGLYDRKAVEVFADSHRNTMTTNEVAACLGVSNFKVAELASQGKLHRLSYGRYDRKTAEALAKVFADIRRNTMTVDEVAGYLGVTRGRVTSLASQGKLRRLSHGCLDRGSVEAFADTCRNTMTRDEAADYLGVSIVRVDRLAIRKKLLRVSYGRYDRKSVEALAKAFVDTRRDTMTCDEVAGSLGVAVAKAVSFARQGKLLRVSRGRYDRKSVEALATALAKAFAATRRNTMTRAEAADYLGMSMGKFDQLAKQGKLHRVSHGRYDRKSVEAIADTGNT